MDKKALYLLSVAIIMVMVLSACTLKASTPPPPTATPAGSFPFPVGSAQPDALAESMTQTAVAQAPAVAKGTPKAVATKKPTVQATEENSGGGVNEPAKEIPTLTRPSTYTLKAGEFPFCIARRFDVDAGTLLSINGLAGNSQVYAGTVLKIPKTSQWSNGARALRSHPGKYTVVGGETIYSIACIFGDVSPEGIIAANGLKSPYSLSSGTVLQIP
jgi:LysM repeat protein